MSAQLELAEAPVQAPSAWDWARIAYPGKLVVRIIDLRQKRQAFAVVEAENGFLVDGSTHFLHTFGTPLTPQQEDAITAEYDRLWHEHEEADR